MHEPLKTRGFASELRDFLSRAAERGLEGAELVELGRRHGRADWVAAGRFSERYQVRFDLDPEPALDYSELIRAAAGLLTDPEVRAARARRARRGLRGRIPGHRPGTGVPAAAAGGGRGATWSRSAIRTSRSTASAAPMSRGILKFPERFRDAAGRERP